MPTAAGEATIRFMTSAHAANRLVLVGPARGSRGRDGAAVRRYRLARLKVEDQRAGEARFAHLKRVYD
jgi:hypothetical protein